MLHVMRRAIRKVLKVSAHSTKVENVREEIVNSILPLCVDARQNQVLSNGSHLCNSRLTLASAML